MIAPVPTHCFYITFILSFEFKYVYRLLAPEIYYYIGFCFTMDSSSTYIIEPRYEKPGFCMCENKDADQLRNHEADQRLCFHYTDSTIPLLPKCKISMSLAIFCDCAARLVSDLVGNPENRFSHNEVQIG